MLQWAKSFNQLDCEYCGHKTFVDEMPVIWRPMGGGRHIRTLICNKCLSEFNEAISHKTMEAVAV